jgi:hypothetical protein
MNPVQEFLAEERLQKEAADWSGFGRELAVGVGVPLAMLGASEAYGAIKRHIGRERGFKSMLAYNPELAKEPAAKVRAMYNSLHNASPTMAQDPVVASSWVRRTMYHDDYIDPRTISDIAGAERSMRQPGLLEQMPVAQITSSLMHSAGQPDAFAAADLEQRKYEETLSRGRTEADKVRLQGAREAREQEAYMAGATRRLLDQLKTEDEFKQLLQDRQQLGLPFPAHP